MANENSLQYFVQNGFVVKKSSCNKLYSLYYGNIDFGHGLTLDQINTYATMHRIGRLQS